MTGLLINDAAEHAKRLARVFSPQSYRLRCRQYILRWHYGCQVLDIKEKLLLLFWMNQLSKMFDLVKAIIIYIIFNIFF